MTLTRRGRRVRNAAVVVLVAVGLTLLGWAWESGQAKQCDWYRQHASPQQARSYCGP